jgi:hypothetical protein
LHLEDYRLSGPKTTGKTSVSQNERYTGATFEPDLQALVDAWPTLPAALKAGILAMVRAAGGGA